MSIITIVRKGKPTNQFLAVVKIIGGNFGNGKNEKQKHF